MTQVGGATRRPITDIDIINTLSTGLVSGGELTINSGDSAKIDIAEGTGLHIDNYSTAARVTDPIITPVSWDDILGVSLDFISTNAISAVGMDKDGNVVQRAVTFDAEERRDFILLGRPIHTDLTTVAFIDEQIYTPNNPASNLVDFSFANGAINFTGGKFSPNGVNLKIDRAEAELFAITQNWKANRKNPNFITTPAESHKPFFYTWRDGSGGFVFGALETDLNPSRYDDGTGGVSVPNGVVPTGSWTVSKIYSFEAVVLHYGVNFYDSALEAFENRFEEFERSPDTEDLIFRGWILARSGATDLSDTTQALFVNADRFGVVVKSVGGILRTGHISAEISIDQSIPSGIGWTDIEFDVEVNDKHNFTHSTSTNPELFTADTDMVVTINTQTLWDAAANRNYQVRVLKNGSDIISIGADDSGSATSLVDAETSRSNIRLLKGDTIKIQARHTNGSSLDVFSDGTFISIQQDI